jgi:hypothetical protein
LVFPSGGTNPHILTKFSFLDVVIRVDWLGAGYISDEVIAKVAGIRIHKGGGSGVLLYYLNNTQV